MVNVALIGVGYWGPNLLRNLITNNRFDLKIVVDLSEERRSYVRQHYPSVKVLSEVNDVFNDAEIDAVVIATPVKTHYDLSVRALKAGKHILVEKPMVTTLKELKHVEEIAKQNKCVAMSGHTFLFNNAVRYVKTLIESGDLGDVRYIYAQRLNLGRIRSDVDALWNLAPHDISIVQYWLNDLAPSHISRNGMSYIQDGIEDVVFMNIQYPNKVLVNVHVSWLDPHKVRKIIVVGSKKMVVYDDISENKIAIYDKGIDQKAILGEKMDYDLSSIQYSYRNGDLLMPKINFIEPLKTEIHHFADCIENDEPCITGLEHTKNVISILSQENHLINSERREKVLV
ncbi:oxidoreductase [Candidatus Marinamargulisbacteria bacterium SCGC AG-333-B06]|nr:oxidoreductase [Candidatus Marinamargulisbacteria bacterium SCGC AG-333-B06]